MIDPGTQPELSLDKCLRHYTETADKLRRIVELKEEIYLLCARLRTLPTAPKEVPPV